MSDSETWKRLTASAPPALSKQRPLFVALLVAAISIVGLIAPAPSAQTQERSQASHVATQARPQTAVGAGLEMHAWLEAAEAGSMEQEWSIVYESIQRVL